MIDPEWLMWDSETAAARPDVVEAVADFVGLDVPLGADAAKWLRDQALANDGSTRTRLLVSAARVEGYIALCAGTVQVDASAVQALGLPAGRHLLPAVVLAWIARHRDTEVSGQELMDIAFAIARRTRREIGAVAFALDPGDEAVARIWRGRSYGFRPSTRGRRLWVPLSAED
jgi:hypothetical protein